MSRFKLTFFGHIRLFFSDFSRFIFSRQFRYTVFGFSASLFVFLSSPASSSFIPGGPDIGGWLDANPGVHDWYCNQPSSYGGVLGMAGINNPLCKCKSEHYCPDDNPPPPPPQPGQCPVLYRYYVSGVRINTGQPYEVRGSNSYLGPVYFSGFENSFFSDGRINERQWVYTVGGASGDRDTYVSISDGSPSLRWERVDGQPDNCSPDGSNPGDPSDSPPPPEFGDENDDSPDSDGDGIPDPIDPGPVGAPPDIPDWTQDPPDFDGDGIPDPIDPNPTAPDSDAPGGGGDGGGGDGGDGGTDSTDPTDSNDDSDDSLICESQSLKDALSLLGGKFPFDIFGSGYSYSSSAPPRIVFQGQEFSFPLIAQISQLLKVAFMIFTAVSAVFLM